MSLLSRGADGTRVFSTGLTRALLSCMRTGRSNGWRGKRRQWLYVQIVCSADTVLAAPATTMYQRKWYREANLGRVQNYGIVGVVDHGPDASTSNSGQRSLRLLLNVLATGSGLPVTSLYRTQGLDGRSLHSHSCGCVGKHDGSVEQYM